MQPPILSLDDLTDFELAVPTWWPPATAIRGPSGGASRLLPFLRKLQVELPISGAPIGIVTLKRRQLSPVVRLFLDCAREAAKPLAMVEQQVAS